MQNWKQIDEEKNKSDEISFGQINQIVTATQKRVLM